MSFITKTNQSIKHGGYIYLKLTWQSKQYLITTLAKDPGDLLLSWGGGLMFTRSALKYGGQIKYMQITSSRGTNGLTLPMV